MEQLLFDREAAVNQATTGGYAPLFIAEQEGHFPVVQLLLDHEAPVDQAETRWLTPLLIAAPKCHLPWCSCC